MQVFELCNPKDPSTIPKRGIPFSFKCDLVDIRSISNTLSLGSLDGQSALVLAPPVEMPFVSNISSMLTAPMYDLTSSAMKASRNDLIALIFQSDQQPRNAQNYSSLSLSRLDLEHCNGGQVIIGGNGSDCDYCRCLKQQADS